MSATDFEEASGAAKAAPGIPVQCVVSERVRARNAQCPWYWSTTTSKSQEFGGLQPRDERSRHPSLGLPRVGGQPDRGRPVFSGPVNWWRKSLAHSSRSKLAARASRCRTPLQALARASQADRPSRSPASASRCSCPSPERKVGRRQARLPDIMVNATAANTSSSSTRLMLGSVVGSLHPRDERSSHLEFGWSRPHGANRRCHSVE